MSQELNTGVYGIYYQDKLIYVGSAAQSFKERWRIHKLGLSKNKHHSAYIQRIYNKHGIDVLIFKTLEICEPQDCIKLEQVYLDSYFHEGLANGSPSAGSMLGYKHTDAARLNMSKAKQGILNNRYGIRLSDDVKEKIGKSNTGKQRTEELRKKLSVINTGKLASNEAKVNMSQAQKRIWSRPNQKEAARIRFSGEKNPFYGKFHNLSTKEAIKNKKLEKSKLPYTTKSRNKWRAQYHDKVNQIKIYKNCDTQLEAFLYVYSKLAILNKEYCEVAANG